MNISDLPKPALYNLLLFIEPTEMRIVCISKNSKVHEICYLPRFIDEYTKKYKYNERLLTTFEAPILIENDMVRFLLSADFGQINTQIHEIIDPIIQKGIFSRIIIQLILLIYTSVNTLESEKNYSYKMDQHMKTYFIENIMFRENIMFPEFNPNQLSFYRLVTLVSSKIHPVSTYSVYDKIALRSAWVQNYMEEVMKKLRTIKGVL